MPNCESCRNYSPILPVLAEQPKKRGRPRKEPAEKLLYKFAKMSEDEQHEFLLLAMSLNRSTQPSTPTAA